MDIKSIIEKYQLTPHPEGGYFREIYRSNQSVASPINGKERNTLTHIYFMLPMGELSRFHRVEHDEIWNLYDGDPLKLIMFDGENMTETIIGKGYNDFTAVVPAGVWQAAESIGEYSLVGCSVAPGFDFEDFRFMNEIEKSNIEKEWSGFLRFC